MFRKMLNDAVSACGKQETLAEKLEITPATLSRKISGETGWHEDEINKVMELSGGCKNCRESQNKILNSYNIVLKAQLDHIEQLEKAK